MLGEIVKLLDLLLREETLTETRGLNQVLGLQLESSALKHRRPALSHYSNERRKVSTKTGKGKLCGHSPFLLIRMSKHLHLSYKQKGEVAAKSDMGMVFLRQQIA